MTPQRVHFLPPPLLCKSKSKLMCQQLREIGGGVVDADCCSSEYSILALISISITILYYSSYIVYSSSNPQVLYISDITYIGEQD